MNLQLVYNCWKKIQNIADSVGDKPENVLDEALKLYTDRFEEKDEDPVVEKIDEGPLNEFIKDLDIFVKSTMKDKNSVHYNFVMQWVDMIASCAKPDSSFEFRMRKMVHILYKKNKEYSKIFLDELGVTREELQNRILEDIFGGDV